MTEWKRPPGQEFGGVREITGSYEACVVATAGLSAIGLGAVTTVTGPGTLAGAAVGGIVGLLVGAITCHDQPDHGIGGLSAKEPGVDGPQVG